MDAAGELAQLLARRFELALDVGQQLAGAALADARRERLDLGRDGGEPALGAVAELRWSRRRWASAASTMRRREAASCSARATTSACRRTLVSASRVAAATASTSSGSSSTVRSWTSTAMRSPSASTGVTARSPPGSGSANGRPASSA